MTELNKQIHLEYLDEESLDEENEEEYEKRTFNYDPEQINIVTKEPTIDLLLRRIDEEALNLAPDFQRQAGIWDTEAKSRLIESILIRIPLPAFYIDGTNEEEWLVVDGLQRLSTLKQFVSDRTLKLTGLEYLIELEGKTYDELERRYQRRIEETQVTVYLIAKGTPVEVKYNIFKRINTGGIPLSNQELRHALNPGQATKFLEKLTKCREFTRVVKLGESRKKRMDDREFILGFLAFKLTSYKKHQDGDRDTFLNQGLVKANQLSEIELNNIENDFKKAMIAAFDIFGDNAFRKQSSNKRKFPLNKALFEAWSVNLSELNEQKIETLKIHKKELIRKFISKSDNDKEFLASISQAANKVEYRFSTIEKIIQEVLL
ncbi:DUF262 domain-containing protein [Mastigocoleus testarum]|uniref:GmrSD restriction endonucleases N-terminal domain-containing protein n=1 Tax=Mastigocoleus testarum BC008 TaxID=371196 RepID=A0A0V7ZRB1_9CYAN|nr:DUF262 domain-containing protein [Mastigocoleus testarum]KST66986.1 hypothetical protein BC008_27750 [Mastigocoleus testarum BC008]KST67125.1 hypothetical protein BC008_28430 [Mastigocoleus testarum BC008]